MARNLGPRKIGKYPIEFKAKAVALSRLPGLKVRQVAESLGIHPFMLSRWRKEARDGLFVVSSGKLGLDAKQVAELKRLRQVEQENRVLKEELTLLKKAIRFCSDRKRRSMPSWNRTGINTK
jgi:transposase